MEQKSLICFNCKNYTSIDGCLAFKDGEIPHEIMTSNVHDEPIENQGNDIVFIQRDENDFVDDFIPL